MLDAHLSPATLAWCLSDGRPGERRAVDSVTFPLDELSTLLSLLPRGDPSPMLSRFVPNGLHMAKESLLITAYNPQIVHSQYAARVHLCFRMSANCDRVVVLESGASWLGPSSGNAFGFKIQNDFSR